MRRLSQYVMLIEIVVIILPITCITILSAPFVLMLTFSLPIQFANLMLGVTHGLSCTALIALWVLALGFWVHGTQRLQSASRKYFVLATLGCFIAAISCAMAFFRHKTAFLLGVPLLLPYAHLVYELVSSLVTKNA